MLKKSIWGMILLAITLLPFHAMGQKRDGGRWWTNPDTAKELKLTKEEKTKLNKQYRESRPKLIDLRGDVKKEQSELENLLEAKELDEKAIKEQWKKLEAARTRLSDERFSSIMRYRKILGKDRFQILKTKMKKRHPRKDRKKKWQKKDKSVDPQ